MDIYLENLKYDKLANITFWILSYNNIAMQ